MVLVARILDPDLVIPWDDNLDPSFWLDLLSFADCDSRYGITEATRRELASRLDDLGLLSQHQNPGFASMIDAAIRWAPVMKTADTIPADQVRELSKFLEDKYLAGTDDLKIIACLEAIAGVDQKVVEMATRVDNWSFEDGIPGETAKGNSSDSRRVFVLNSHPERSHIVEKQAERVELLESNPTVRAMEDNSQDLFPQLVFSDRFWNSANHFKGEINHHKARFVHALGLLNDEGLRIFDNPAGSRGVVSEFKKRDFSVSDESGSTKAGGRFRREREAEFEGIGCKACFWHLKFSDPTLRVYFEHTPDAILMGLVNRHFSTSSGAPR